MLSQPTSSKKKMMVVRTTKSPRVFAINPDQKEIDINKRIPELEKII